MNFVIQRLIADSKFDFKNIEQIIFFAIIAVFWIIGAIAKSFSKKAPNNETPGKQKVPLKQQPAPKPVQHKPYQRPIKPVAQPEIALDIQRQIVEEPVKKGLIVSNLDLPEIPVFSENLLDEEVSQTIYYEESKVKEHDKLPLPKTEETFPNFASTDDLKKGILYYEVLGKPLSLREEERSF